MAMTWINLDGIDPAQIAVIGHIALSFVVAGLGPATMVLLALRQF